MIVMLLCWACQYFRIQSWHYRYYSMSCILKTGKMTSASCRLSCTFSVFLCCVVLCSVAAPQQGFSVTLIPSILQQFERLVMIRKRGGLM